MAEAFGAFPELRYPFQETPIHPQGSTTVLYQGKTITLTETGAGDAMIGQRSRDAPGDHRSGGGEIDDAPDARATDQR